MKLTFLFFILIGCRGIARTQVQSGTTGYFDFSHDELTIAMDSGSRNPNTGENINTECKISALGNKVVFVFTGAVRDAEGKWSAHDVARHVWQQDRLKEFGADKLITLMVKDWTSEMTLKYGHLEVIRGVEAWHQPEPMLGSGMFIATDSRGGFAAKGMDLLYDRSLFISSQQARILAEPIDCPSDGCHAGIGHDEVVNEFRGRTSERAKEFMHWFDTKTATLSPSRRVRQLATQLVELSILLEPSDPPLRFPIDVIQLRRGKNVEWIYKKDSCPAK